MPQLQTFREPVSAMSTKSPILLLLTCIAVLFLGDGSIQPISILAPFPTDSISYDQGKLLLVSASRESAPSLLVSTQWETKKLFDLNLAPEKENFAKEFYKLVPPQSTIQSLVYSYRYFSGYGQPETLSFAYTDTVGIRTLWQNPEFIRLVKKVQLAHNISEVLIDLRGWTDSTLDTPYDDPNAEGRALYKIHVRLLPGSNEVFLAPSGEKKRAVKYATVFRHEGLPAAERSHPFHNSKLEASCTTCHDGLPSASQGASMTADCNVCHKAMTAATFKHAPAEMKECASCHAWSAEKHAVGVEKGIPNVCYDCHAEKQAEIENAASPHPVASECITCHSPHGSEQKHIVTSDIYSLCTSCHEDHKVNHPVGRHPLQFYPLGNGEEISCVSCHNPHGSEHESMLRVPGGRMGICEGCH